MKFRPTCIAYVLLLVTNRELYISIYKKKVVIKDKYNPKCAEIINKKPLESAYKRNRIQLTIKETEIKTILF